MESKKGLPRQQLYAVAAKQEVDIYSREFAAIMDWQDPLKEFRNKFAYPQKCSLLGTKQGTGGRNQQDSSEEERDDCVYLCGNSLGLKPKSADFHVMTQLSKWADIGVHMHFEDPLPAALCDRPSRGAMGRLVGAAPATVTLMNGLTVNLHLLMLSFYEPTPQRYKILIEGRSFPSDRYAMVSQIELRGYSPDTALLQINPRPGEDLIRHEDILELLEREGPSIAVVCLSGVQYYTGQKFDMGSVTAAGQKQGCLVGWDLAHAVGNVELCLDKWGVDFACWCTYKYLNGGPGCIAGAYVNKKHDQRYTKCSQLQGWWSNRDDTRFAMKENCDTAPGVDGYRLCNPPVLLVALVEASLEVFEEAGMPRLLEKQRLLTGYLELLMKKYFCQDYHGKTEPTAKILTSENPDERGCQLSLCFSMPLQRVHDELSSRGVVCDIRMPNVMRLAPVPLYNSFTDVYHFIVILRDVFECSETETPLRGG